MISGYYGFDNCGDEAILMVMIQEFSKYIPKEKITVLSNQPEKTKDLYQVDSILRTDLLSIINKLKQTSVIISGGGGLLQDVTGKGFSVLYYAGLIFLAGLFKVPAIVYGQSIGPIKNKFNQLLVKNAFKNVNLIIVRDDESKVFLEKMNVLNKNIIVNADIAFLLKKANIPNTIKKKYEMDKLSFIDNNNLKIGIVIRNCNDIAKDYEKKITQLAKIADYLIEKHKSTLFFIPFQSDADIAIIKDIKNKMKFTSARIIDEKLNPKEILSLISEFTLIIGMRLHSIIFATINEIPFIAIEYNSKVKDYVNSLSLNELLINLNQLTVKNIEDKLKYIDINEKMIKSRLKEKRIQFEQKASLNTYLFNKFIDENVLGRN